MVQHNSILIEGISIFYREAGNQESPKLVLLGGFPASSHQFRNLIPALADKFHLISPDYPGFGNSDMPDPAAFPYTFDKLSDIVEDLLLKKGFERFGLFMQDYGGPVGFRIISRHPEWAEWLILQNSNAYEEGFTPAWDGIRHALWKNPTPETEQALMPFLELEGIKMAYLHGHKNPELISPDNWNMDFGFMKRPNARRMHLDLFYDYRKNVELYPEWQKYLRDRQPKTLIFWGQNDIFFTPQGGDAYLRDLPDAEMHRLDTGHFAVEDSVDEIQSGIRRFYDEKIAPFVNPTLITRSA
jgi:pimeloyl-ACP methyl ester carboxylesterase